MRKELAIYCKKSLSYLKEKTIDQLTDYLFAYTFIIVLLKSLALLGIIASANFTSIDIKRASTSISSNLVYACFILGPMSFALLLKGRKRFWYLVLFNVVVSILMIFDLWYYRGYNSFLSVHQLNQLVNLDNLGDSIFSMVRPMDFVLVADAVVIFITAFFVKGQYRDAKRNVLFFFIILAFSVGVISYTHYRVDIHDRYPKFRLFKVCWTPRETIFNLSPLGYHLFDAYEYLSENSTKTLTKSEEKEINDWYQSKNESLPDNKYKGMFKGKNLIMVQVESLENFVIGQKINGQEITPNLNKLLPNSIYFPNIYEQVNNGTSSDSDLMINTSVYPVRRGSTFFRFPANSYNSMPKLMQAEGYNTIAIHSDKGAYWNWMMSLKNIGFQKCIDAKFFNQNEQIGLGLSDGSYFKQLEPVIKSEKQPFYNFIVTLSSHGPFNIPQQYRQLKLDESMDKTKLGGYFQSFNYTDRQIGEFLSMLDADGILDNSVVVFFGDHCGVHKYYQDELYSIHPQENWWLDNNKRIPLIIYQKNTKGEKLSVTGGQIDIMPTVAYLMGIDENKFKDTAMGRILVKTNKDFAVLNDYSFIGSDKDSNDKNKALKGIDIADKIISSNYFYPAYANKK